MPCRPSCRDSTRRRKLVISTAQSADLITLDEMERRYTREVLGLTGRSRRPWSTDAAAPRVRTNRDEMATVRTTLGSVW